LSLLLLRNQLRDSCAVIFRLFAFLICDAIDAIHAVDQTMICIEFFIGKQIICGLRHEPDLVTQVGFLANKNPSCSDPVVCNLNYMGESRVFMSGPFSVKDAADMF